MQGKIEQFLKMASVSPEIQKLAELNPEIVLFPTQERARDRFLNNNGQILLAHGTGTGKTIASIAAIEAGRDAGKVQRTLVIAPTSLRKNYMDAIIKASKNSTVTLLGSQQEARRGEAEYLDTAKGSDYNVVGIEMFRKDPKGIVDRLGVDTVVFDEAHKGNNPQTSTYKSLMDIRPQLSNVIAMTGSEVTNNPADIIPLLSFVTNKNHDLPNSRKEFKRDFITKLPDKQKGHLWWKKTIKGEHVLRPEKITELSNALAPYVDYATLDDVKGDTIPRKEVQVIPVEMSKQQRKLYDYAMRQAGPVLTHMVKKNIPPGAADINSFFKSLMLARQVSNSIHTLDTSVTPTESSLFTPKVKRVISDLQEHLSTTPDAQAMLYSNLNYGGTDVLRAGLDRAGIGHGIFLGKQNLGSSEQERQQAVQDYKDGKSKVLVVSSAGTEGIDLPNTTMIQMLDGHYNPAKIQQAEARGIRAGGQSHRDPADRKVDIRRYVSTLPKGTSVDEWIYNIANRKEGLIGQFRDVLRNLPIAYASQNMTEAQTKLGEEDSKSRGWLLPTTGAGGAWLGTKLIGESALAARPALGIMEDLQSSAPAAFLDEGGNLRVSDRAYDVLKEFNLPDIKVNVGDVTGPAKLVVGGNYYAPAEHKIQLGWKSSPSILAHELGHAAGNRQGKFLERALIKTVLPSRIAMMLGAGTAILGDPEGAASTYVAPALAGVGGLGLIAPEYAANRRAVEVAKRISPDALTDILRMRKNSLGVYKALLAGSLLAAVVARLAKKKLSGDSVNEESEKLGEDSNLSTAIGGAAGWYGGQELATHLAKKMKFRGVKGHAVALGGIIAGMLGGNALGNTLAGTKQAFKLEDKYTFQGFPISIENSKGSTRSGTDSDGHEWSSKMNCDYGYIRNKDGADGDKLDVFIGPDEKATSVFILRQKDPKSGKFDEDKVLLGFKSMKDALKTYLGNYDRQDHVEGIREVPLDAFRLMLKTYSGKKLTAPEYLETNLKVILKKEAQIGEYEDHVFSLLNLIPGFKTVLASLKLGEDSLSPPTPPASTKGLNLGSMGSLKRTGGVPTPSLKAKSVNVPGIPTMSPPKVAPMA